VFIGAGTGGAGGAVAPPTAPKRNYWGATSNPGAPIFSVIYSLKNLVCKVTFNTKILENCPASGALTHTPLYTAYTFFEKYMLHKVVL